VTPNPLSRAARGLPLAAALLLAAACSPPAATGWSGYAEGDYVQVAAPLGGTLIALAVQAGQTVARDAPLFTLESDAEMAARAEAQARQAGAQAQARNIDSGKRDDEIAVIRAQLVQARAADALARSELARLRPLQVQGFVSQARLDDAVAVSAQSEARINELEAALRVAQLPGRVDERDAARASASAADQALRQTQWRLDQKQQRAPAAAQVHDTYFRVGEWVPAGQPVVSLLPPGAVKARFFVAETDVAKLAPGQAVELRCDGCGAPIAATIRRIATRAEYTPPVIYSNEQRARLVFMVEAWPAPADAPRLRPGQPLDVRRAAGA
jgi:HlyD family secretion protein